MADTIRLDWQLLADKNGLFDIAPAESHASESVYSLELSVRTRNAMQRERINTIGDLLQWGTEDLVELRCFGITSLREVQQKLKEKYGIRLTKGWLRN